jgi:hypothetical protein
MYFERYDANHKTWVQMNSTEQTYFFNRAHCECNQDQTNYSGYVKIQIRPPTTTWAKISALLTANSFSLGIGRLFAGGNTYNCLSPSSAYGLSNYCTNLVDPSTYKYDASFSLSIFNTQGYYETPPIPVSAFFGASLPTTCGSNGTCNDPSVCNQTQVATVVSLWAQTKAGTTPDFTDALGGGTLNIVGESSTQPSNITVDGGNEALTVKWSWPTGYSPATDANFFGVQIFCQRGPDYQVFPGTFGNRYQTAATTCGGLAPTTSYYGAFSELNPNYLCSGLIPPSTSSYRIEGLQNDYFYGIGIGVVDKYYNVSPIDPSAIAWGKPVPTVDFYTEYRDQGGAAQGGFCAIVARGASPSIATLLLLAGTAAILRLRRRSRKRSPGAGPLLLVVGVGLLASRQAKAQPVYHDSSLAEDRAEEAWGGTPRQFAIETRFGLYTPNVDSEISGVVKPHSLVFGNKRRPMWQVEFDWEFLQEFGTLSLGGVIGYYKENASACTLAGFQKDPKICEPSGADNTSLRLIPLAALLVYRMDEAANRWKIPVVPYGKLGLNYTIWTVNNGNGEVPGYGTNGHGQGGTMGWQAAIGLSLRLDFLDPSAARGFDADSGVNHSYAFFELDHVNGSGLYRKDVLRVGDDTWFAGLMFEF